MDKKEFFDSNTELGKKRERSPELDFGVHWRDGRNWPTYRVSWIQDTGEVYAYENNSGKIEILGTVKSDITLDELHKAGKNYRDLRVEQLLKDWADHCGEINGLQWVRNQLG